MKKTILNCLAASLMLAGCSNKSADQSGYVINGSLKGISSGTIKLQSYNEDDRSSKTVDSGTVTNGTFKLQGQLDAPQMMTLTIEPGKWSFNVFVDNATVTVTADTAGAEHYDYTKYGEGKGAQLKKFTEQGSKNYDDWMAYQNDPGQKKFDPVYAELDKKFKAAGNNVDAQYKVRDQMDSVRKVQQAWQKTKIDEYITKNPSSVAGVYMFNNLYQFSSDMPVTTLEATLNKFTGEAKSSAYYKSLAASLAKLKAVQPGAVAPDFTLLKRDSSKYTLSSTRGKYTMIDFWASWCHPCRQAIPHWKSVYQKYNAKGFEIVSVSDDSKWKDWFKAMDVEKMPWTQVCDEFPIKNMPSRIGSLYMTTYIPYYVLLDKEGKILVSSGDEKKIDEKLKEVFGS
ncbi:Thiol-disulfide isomerase or thioredoxin [Mucilaginibacter pineti]|uniref:Thiol-disulfide isomerase or thioredoxin n=1 Tax=Mucilaginibacter pineti TaxID=1391627 RepID=A0A1G6UD83_9SPHI|nr:TlpA disulfide reductase family protein [Mucilaginibacter pineti]SDD38547.1 Thiol-disulfide isomerase or thioredoxin [Mucilaginibacter pineti]